MPRDSITHTLTITVVLCVVCSVLVSAAAVGLRDRQEANQARERNRNILIAAGFLVEGQDTDSNGRTIEELYETHIVSRVVRLDTGAIVPEERVPPEAYELNKMLQSDDLSTPLSQSEDIAGIRRQQKFAVVYEVHDDEGGPITGWVLPVRGYGLWSTLYGFLALADDLTTIRGLTFYQHGETPGLGGEVDNPAWKDQWRDPEHPKLAYDEQGEVAITVIKSKVAADDPEREHRVDGLAGATITTRGVSSLLQYWLGGVELSREVTIDGETKTKTTVSGFGPFLDGRRQATGGKEADRG